MISPFGRNDKQRAKKKPEIKFRLSCFYASTLTSLFTRVRISLNDWSIKSFPSLKISFNSPCFSSSQVTSSINAYLPFCFSILTLIEELPETPNCDLRNTQKQKCQSSQRVVIRLFAMDSCSGFSCVQCCCCLLLRCPVAFRKNQCRYLAQWTQ